MPGSISFHLQITHENKQKIRMTEFFIFHRLIDEIVMLDQ